MVGRIAVIQGHPDPAGAHFCHALADAYAEGALTAKREVRRIEVARLAFPLLRTQRDFEDSDPPADIVAAQADLKWADHWLLVYPLWHGDVPALLKAFIEQAFRPNFALRYKTDGFPEKLLSGRSARIVVTMGMPAVAYRYWFLSHSLKSLERNVLRFSGVSPVRTTLIGSVAGLSRQDASGWLDAMGELGRTGR